MKYDIVVAGELLIDFITKDYVATLDEANTFERFKGGSAANLCSNIGLLGGKSALVATVGSDDMGQYLMNSLENLPLDKQFVRRSELPTTLILVTRTQDASDFQAYRGADADITPEQLPDELLSNSKIFHTTCFAIAQQPARNTILDAAKRATAQGATVSIDINYRPKLWRDRKAAQATIHQYIGMGALVKCSEVDWEELYAQPLTDPKAAAQHFIDLGATAVSVTLGTEGAYSLNRTGDGGFLPARKVKVIDTTGAGDAFWSGFLVAWLDGKSMNECTLAGRTMAETKIGIAGQLSQPLDKEQLLYSAVV